MSRSQYDRLSLSGKRPRGYSVVLRFTDLNFSSGTLVELLSTHFNWGCRYCISVASGIVVDSVLNHPYPTFEVAETVMLEMAASFSEHGFESAVIFIDPN